MKPIRILIADDHEVIRKGVRSFIESHPGWECCGEADNGRSAVSLASTLRPDIAILDLGMPELGGLESARQIKHILPGTEILIFSGEQSEDLVHEVFEAGAKSYIYKTDISDHLVSAIEALSQHKTYFTSRISEIVFSRYLDGTNGKKEDKGISPREREIVQLLAEGGSNKELSTKLGISVKTVETHRAAVMRKLRLKTFADLVRYAVRNKLVVG